MSPDMQHDSYFIALGDGQYQPTEHAAGAWRDDELHLAPVAGLLIHHLERWRIDNVDPSLEFSRFNIEVLGQIAREEIALSTRVVRPGRTIELVEVTAEIGGRVTLLARAWLLQKSDTSVIAGHEFDAMPAREDCTQTAWLKSWKGGFIDSIAAVQPADNKPGRARAWVSSSVKLVAGEESTTLAEYAKLLDTANGIGVREDPTQWLYPNVDLTLHLFRRPTHTEVGFDGKVAFGANGIGLTSTVIHDQDGPVGMVQQSLTVRKR